MERVIPEQLQTPLLRANPKPQTTQLHISGIDDDDVDTQLDKALRRLHFSLSFLGFNQSSIVGFGLSWVAFLVLGVAIPILILELRNCAGCEEDQVKDFEFDCLASQACVGSVSLICLSHNLRKYGIRKFLFVDRHNGHISRFMDQYIQKIWNSYRMLLLWLLPCIILKTAREIIRIWDVQNESWWQSAAIVIALIIACTYLNAISLASCILFHLVCNLQVIHFEDYAKLLERESDIVVLIEEHNRLRHNLSKISHRFRIYLLLLFLVVTATQFITLLQTTGYSGSISFSNGGDFAVTSVVQVVGIILCLHGATKISHRAQAIASVASKWHAILTNNSSGILQSRLTSSASSVDASNSNHRIPPINFSESDLESMYYFSMLANSHLATIVSSYHQRESFVMYLQTNPGGITIFGWTVDRGLISTIFFIELSLVLFVLGQTVVFMNPSSGI
ncbi:hypothetical protein V2J09_004168 [Rumex salicifolius]